MIFLEPILIILALIFMIISISIAYFLPNDRLRTAVIYGFLAGLFAGVSQNTLLDGLILGALLGIFFNLFMIPSAFVTKSFQKKGLKILQNNENWSGIFDFDSPDPDIGTIKNENRDTEPPEKRIE